MITGTTERVGNRLLLLALMALTLLPLLSTLSAALAPPGSFPSGLSWPTDPHPENFATAYRSAQFLTLLGSSLLIAAVVVPVTVILAALAGFALGTLRVPGGRIVLALLLLGLTVPAESTITPLYYQMRSYGLLGTRWAIILPLIGSFLPFSVYWMRTHFLGVPAALTEAGRVDGATTWQVFRRIHFPLAVPSFASLGLLLFLWSMNSFLIPLVMVTDPTRRTLAGALAAFQGEHVSDTVLLNAGALLIALPALVVFLIFQRQFLQGLVDGAVK